MVRKQKIPFCTPIDDNNNNNNNPSYHFYIYFIIEGYVPAAHSKTKMCLYGERYPQELLQPYLSPYPSPGGVPAEGPSWEVPLSLRRGCPLLVFSSFFWALTVEYLGEIKKQDQIASAKNSDHLFVGPSHFLNGRSPIPTMGYYLSNPSTHFKCSLAIHPQHTIKVLLVLPFQFSIVSFSFQFSIHVSLDVTSKRHFGYTSSCKSSMAMYRLSASNFLFQTKGVINVTRSQNLQTCQRRAWPLAGPPGPSPALLVPH